MQCKFGDMAIRLRVLITLAEDLVINTLYLHGNSQLSETLVPRHLDLGHCGLQSHSWYTDMYAGKTLCTTKKQNDN